MEGVNQCIEVENDFCPKVFQWPLVIAIIKGNYCKKEVIFYLSDFKVITITILLNKETFRFHNGVYNCINLESHNVWLKKYKCIQN